MNQLSENKLTTHPISEDTEVGGNIVNEIRNQIISDRVKFECGGAHEDHADHQDHDN